MTFISGIILYAFSVEISLLDFLKGSNHHSRPAGWDIVLVEEHFSYTELCLHLDNFNCLKFTGLLQNKTKAVTRAPEGTRKHTNSFMVWTATAN